jgi:ATP-dependent Lon protease
MIQTKKIQVLPLIAVRGMVIYPAMILHFDVARKKSISALEAAMADNQEILLVSQKDLTVEIPTKKDLYTIGTVAKIKQILKLPGDTVRVLVEGLYRAKLSSFIKTTPHDECECTEVRSRNKRVPSSEITALKRKVVDTFRCIIYYLSIKSLLNN